MVQGLDEASESPRNLGRVELDQDVRREEDGETVFFATRDDRTTQAVRLRLHVPRVVDGEPETGAVGHGLEVREGLVGLDEPPGVGRHERLLVRLRARTAERPTEAADDRRLDPPAPLPLDAVAESGRDVAETHSEGVRPGIRLTDGTPVPAGRGRPPHAALVESDASEGPLVPVEPDGAAPSDDLGVRGLVRGQRRVAGGGSRGGVGSGALHEAVQSGGGLDGHGPSPSGRTNGGYPLVLPLGWGSAIFLEITGSGTSIHFR